MKTFEGGVWPTRCLMLCWALQVICAGIYVALGIVLLVVVHDLPAYEVAYVEQSELSLAIAIGGVLLAFGLLTIALSVAEAVRYGRQALSPAPALALVGLKTLVWLALSVVLVVWTARRVVKAPTLVIGLVLFVACLTQLVGTVVFRRRLLLATRHVARG